MGYALRFLCLGILVNKHLFKYLHPLQWLLVLFSLYSNFPCYATYKWFNSLTKETSRLLWKLKTHQSSKGQILVYPFIPKEGVLLKTISYPDHIQPQFFGPSLRKYKNEEYIFHPNIRFVCIGVCSRSTRQREKCY